ncbi:CmpA/NrtA family ABC transporter substrate-binding protein [Caulobacter sp. BE254]|uniref:CmpA/NrtA family ABC transporter substrate-binding protein n=1 Tax=Caulobacter sp. BE254 TaxID=2817720 RepID=UPI00285953B7|nr:CmpA/NrtA family ABC transporter substrate-binding protein [Caulobacter sp. BE254]MDR7114577.1 NitT/TauT family transport system ATP-binding protein/nitrate/nitrite transport system substrate-binding protein [Caulobacter sp. BE254]
MSGLADLTLGFIPLTDCAPLVVAKAQGFFAEEGLEVALSREASWATIRDKVAFGALDGAHMLAPMALAPMGLEGGSMLAPLALNQNGSAITVSTRLAAMMSEADPGALAAPLVTAQALAAVVALRRGQGAPPLTFAVVFPHSMHNYFLRYWLAQAGIDPDRDVRLVVTPPPRMVEHLRSGEIDGFCVGAPWNAAAVDEGLGESLIKASQFWPGGPDKVFGVTAAWAASHGDELRAALRALIRAAAWADEPGNHAELVALLSRPDHVGVEPEIVARALKSEIVFHRDAAGLPRREHALWFLSQMVRWGQVGPDLDLAAVADRVYRPDLFRDAALSLGPVVEPAQVFADAAPAPSALFDGALFDPADARGYAASFAVGRAS